MKCPYCQKEMLFGYIPNGDQPVQWIPAGKTPSLLSFSTASDGVALQNRYSPLKANGYRADACHCPNCKIVIAKTE